MTLPEPRQLRPYQIEAVDRVEHAWSNNDQRVSVVLPTGSGKSVPHITPVPTPDGVRKHGDLRVGDYVFHQSGVPTRVTHIHPQGSIDVWRITFSDKTSVLASKNHIWKVWRRRRKAKLMTTGQLLESPLVDFADNGAYMWRIPMTKPTRYPEADLPVDPYTMGALIANGHLGVKGAYCVKLTTPDVEVHERVLAVYPDAVVKQYGNYCPYLTFTHHREIFQAVCDLGINVKSAHKFIPDIYLTGSVTQRVALLQGLMDGDGSSRGGGRRSVYYHTTSSRLAYDIQRLVWSLGGTAQISEKDRVNPSNGDRYIESQVSVLLPSEISPWSSSRKERHEQPRKIFEPHRSIVSIEYAGKEESQCITVDHPDGLYLVGEEHIVTHNSTVIASLASRTRAAGKRAVLLAHRNELLEQMADSVKSVDPSGADIGFVVADRNEPDADIVVASFQTLSRSSKRLASLGRRDVILADECFPAGTKVGDVNIEDLKVGDLVPSYDEKTKTFVHRRVTETMKSKPTFMVKVSFEDGREVVCTSGHRFLTVEHGWRPAAYIESDTVVCDASLSDGESGVRADSVKWLTRSSDTTFNGEVPDGYVYNIEVEGTHTYVLGDGGFVVHNCHHISAPSYLKVLEDLGAMNETSGVRSCGFTATMYRDDKKALGEVWDKIVFERDLTWGIENGYLIKPRGKTVAIEGLNKLAQIKNVAGDYKQSDLDEVMGASIDSTIDAIMTHCPNSAMIVFAVSVEHARTLAEKLTACGIAARDVTGGHNREYRETAYTDFRLGNLNCLVTVQVLTEGADFPRCDTVVLARPTRSKVLFSQVVGRSVRPYTDPVTGIAKTDATVLDLTGIVRDVKLSSLTDLYPEADQSYFDSSGADRSDDEEFLDTLLSRPDKKERKGRLTLEDIDLFDNDGAGIRRKVLWLKTGPINAAGDEIAFLPQKSGKSYMFIYPPVTKMGNEMVAVGHLSENKTVSFAIDPSTNAPIRGSLTQAMDFAEQKVGPKEYIRTDANWRRYGGMPSEKQVALGTRLGIQNSDKLDRAGLSDEITKFFATRLFQDAARRYAL